MSENILYRYELYPVPLADYYSEFGYRWMLYSPLAQSFAFVTSEEKQQIEQQLVETGRIQQDDLYEQLIGQQESQPHNYVDNPNDVYAITILPNNICNFSCSYCYAAKGHAKDQLDIETIKTVLDFFIDPDRLSRRNLYISFGGGGEPLLSWELLKYTLNYSDELARRHQFTIHYSFASNGSVMNQEIIDAIHKYNIKTNISFDVLPEIQAMQRKNYSLVCSTLDTLLSHEIYPTINAVITPANVDKQVQMVEHLHQKFPLLRRVSFDYVVDGGLYADSDALRRFYEDYTKNFFQARRLGKQYGLEVSSIKYHNTEQLK